MATLHFKIITPLRTALETDVQSISLPGAEGELEILPGHTDIITAVSNGELVYRCPGKPGGSLFVGGGFLQVEKEQVVLVTDTALQADEINPSSVQAAIERAKADLRNSASVLSREQQARLEANIAKQLALAEYLRHKKQR